MATKLDICSPGEFAVLGEQTNLAKAWEQYMKRFEYYIRAAGITKDEQKRALLLHVSGQQVQDIFETLPDTGTTYDHAVLHLTNYFKPRKNVAYDRHVFRKAKQEDVETIDNFVVRLSKLAMSCEYGDKDEMVRDQIVDNCRSNDLRKKLLSEQNLTLERVQTIARTYELSEVHANKMSMHDRQPTQEVNKLWKTNKGKQSYPKPKHGATGYTNTKQGATGYTSNTKGAQPWNRRPGQQTDTRPNRQTEGNNPRKTALCYRCGDKGHYGKECVRSRGVICNDCGREGHFARVCKSKEKNVHAINHSGDSDDREDWDEIFVLNGKHDASVRINLQGKYLNILVDSGSSVNAIDRQTFEKLRSADTPLEKSNSKIYPYGGKLPIQLYGKTTLQVTVANKVYQIEFQIINGTGKPLIGHKTATELGLLHIGMINSVTPTNSDTTDSILRSYEDRFTGIGKLKDFQLRLHIDKTVKPVAQPARKIPFKMRQQVEQKLKQLQEMDIVESVTGPTPWVSALVPIPKKDGDIRLCVDMRQANKAVQRERFPMPNIDETLEEMNGASVFSRLDLKQSFHQIELEESSRYITTFASHNGLFRYKRLIFGINSAPETHQRIIQHTIQDIPGCKNIADDIIIYAQNQAEHDKILKLLLERLREKNLTLNKAKCEFNKPELKFMGHTLSKQGIKIDESKVKAVMETEAPKNPTEIKSYLGLVSYCSKFLPNFATIAEPLRKLTRKDVEWQWGADQQSAFDALKQSLTSADVMAYYNANAETRLIVDASPFGVGGILSQKQPNGDYRPVCFASRTLNPVERRFSQTEREALSILFAIQRFNVYLYGMEFEVYTDHRPLERIFTSMHEAPPRIQNWVLKLQCYTFKVRYLPGHLNSADRLSRSPLSENVHTRECTSNTDSYVHYVASGSLPHAIKMEELQRACESDKILSIVRKCLSSNRWAKNPEIKPYFQIRNEITVDNAILLKGTKLIVPASLQTRVLELAHESHFGIVKTKQLVRGKVWWPKIDESIERMIQTCHACQLLSPPPREPQIVTSELPKAPWEKLAMDLTGPYGNNEQLLVIVDYYSRFPVVEIMTSTTSASIINKLRRTFSLLGIPREIVTDNAQNFVSEEFTQFLNENGIKHSRVLPYWPRANGLVERFNKSLNKSIRASVLQKLNWRVEMDKFLLQYRATPHCTTNISPAELLYNRQIVTKVPQYNATRVPRKLRIRDSQQKRKIKMYANRNKSSIIQKFNQGQNVVILKLRDHTKTSPTWEKTPFIVVNQKGTMLLLKSETGNMLRRHVSHVRPYYGNGLVNDSETGGRVHPQRQKRNVKLPKRFDDYHLG
ncbi:MAG: RNase H-like domain-containing protein [Sedimenticola sp.]